MIEHKKETIYKYTDKDCNIYTYNGWKCVMHPEFTGYMFEVYVDGCYEDDPIDNYCWSNHPYNSKKEALDDFIFQAQCPTDWYDDSFYYGYEQIKPIVIKQRSAPRRKVQRGSIHTAWARMVKHRDEYTCTNCGSQENLEAHHIIQYKDSEKLRYCIDNGVTLCNKCHKEYHKKNGR
jgi:hypothetical protein